MQNSGDKTVKGFGRVHREEGLGTASYCFHFIFLGFSPACPFCFRLFAGTSALFAHPSKGIFSKIVLLFSSIVFLSPACLLLIFPIELSFLLRNILFLSVSPYFREDCFLSFLGFHSEASVPYSFHVVASFAQRWFLGRFCLLCSFVTSFLAICTTL